MKNVTTQKMIDDGNAPTGAIKVAMFSEVTPQDDIIFGGDDAHLRSVSVPTLIRAVTIALSEGNP